MINHSKTTHGFETALIMGRECLVIRDFNKMTPFFISIVSDEDHWMYLSSLGGITAGRQNPDHALFPYYTEDKVTDGSETTGSQTVVSGEINGVPWVWEPFSIRFEGRYDIQRNLYKSVWGDMIVFEERNRTLELTYRYAWMTSGKFGFIRRSELVNTNSQARDLQILDGIRNILPSGVTAQIQNQYSCLIDGYKDNRRIPNHNIGLYRMSSLLTDRAEPSESLRATVAWTTLDNLDALLLSEEQVGNFRTGKPVRSESQIRGRRGAFLGLHSCSLPGNATKSWTIVADVDQTQGAVSALMDLLSTIDDVDGSIDEDCRKGTLSLRSYVGLSDGLQSTGGRNVAIHHYANTLFNIMRGGIFPKGYTIDVQDFLSFVKVRNVPVFRDVELSLSSGPMSLDLAALRNWALARNDANIRRLFDEYLPLAFSRRHGDPSRPWNMFDINLRGENGGIKLNYQGNWRDIFQNWEALAFSFPDYLPHVIAKFLNALTPDGYNPYRVTRDGIEWEAPEPDNPWANIGYWGDHQIIYLQRLLEAWEKFDPGIIERSIDTSRYSHADVPYRIRPYDEIIQNPRDTIIFDIQKNDDINREFEILGSDARLFRDSAGEVVHSSLLEKLLIIILAKMANFVPAGGIWMNTQRPEWNDANNALVGPGLSVVTLCYLRRMIVFLIRHLDGIQESHCSIDQALNDHFGEIQEALESDKPEVFHDAFERKKLMDQLGKSVSRYRSRVYSREIFQSTNSRSVGDIIAFLSLAIRHIDTTLERCLRDDGLYDSYNLLTIGEEKAEVRQLQVMLEGQVAVLSAGFLDASAELRLLEELERSPLYREDQDSYLLYPDRELPDFLAMNRVPRSSVEKIPLLADLVAGGNEEFLIEDNTGIFRFHADFRNADVLAHRLDQLSEDEQWRELVTASRRAVLDLYEEVFDHASFTGRSGTFYAYEGLGSIYWHMVSKLLLAVQESAFIALNKGDAAAEGLVHRYYRVRSGLSFNKSPEVYGAFVTDPYSHTPGGSGAKQPGMTGQVKEELLTRWGELGVEIEGGCIGFRPQILSSSEYLESPEMFEYVDHEGRWSTMKLAAGTLGFSYCGVAVQYNSNSDVGITITFRDGSKEERSECKLSVDESLSLFRREGRIAEIDIGTKPAEEG